MNARVHGGPDARGPAPHDFSTNANAAGPCPQALQAIAGADAARYPDPGYTALRERLARLHGVAPARIVIAGSASEFIFRLSAWAARVGLRSVSVPPQGFGDYAQAARSWNLELVNQGATDLLWLCEPSSPWGRSDARVPDAAACRVAVLDLAYEPLRLGGAPSWGAELAERAWRLHTPNKALGLVGVRAAYAIAPLHAGTVAGELAALAPSWPVGAHGVALLQAWCEPAARQWLAGSLQQLRQWKARQLDLLGGLGWHCEPSDSNFFVARPPVPRAWERLRAAGVQLRDCASFGLPGQVRLSVQPPASQDALRRAWMACS